ncbi:MAG: hypothetical protein RMJ28_01195 [Nitrososphaerota archaeon]|nr:hypothetical protein [Candidatus Calditenuaceae archaeon]MDW8072844.1 hypothetical protein [Nitrososphaerota archaeon]
MKTAALKAFLLSSIFFSLVLLLTDAELWAVAPSHAYVLIILILADIMLLGLVSRRIPRAVKSAFYWGTFKTLVLLGDVLTAPQYGLTYAEFAYYLFSLWPFVGLFVSQLGIAFSATLAVREKAGLSSLKKYGPTSLLSLFLLL